jgi:hypothetical protein
MPPPFPLLAGAPQSGLSPGRMWPPYSSLISSAKAVYLQAGAAGCKSGGRMLTRPTRRAPSRESRDEAKHAGSGRGDNTRRGEGQQVEGDGEQTSDTPRGVFACRGISGQEGRATKDDDEARVLMQRADPEARGHHLRGVDSVSSDDAPRMSPRPPRPL